MMNAPDLLVSTQHHIAHIDHAFDLTALRAAECDEVQGCLMARPMPLAELHAVLARG